MRGISPGNVRAFFQFALVGGSGAAVNLATMIVASNTGRHLFSLDEHGPVLGIPLTDFNIRWYHVFATIAFLVANTWNYIVNRAWTFRHANTRSFWTGLPRFMASGLIALGVTVLVITVLLNPTSPLHLPESIFNESAVYRRPTYWANLIGILVAMPVNYLLAKVWTFRTTALLRPRASRRVR